ncbi:unnamed protein product [Rhizoctonia solani]|uniref:Uncharacterized protein n=1 Tax=Rhizoctonia solani TaxID=456999 RepID=A0A8H2XEQ6_9AGAM|nr:unnamed protein product [Rhizoctonia solani]CAE6428707.1 unnamed protein product [Rhizoctonia solani]
MSSDFPNRAYIVAGDTNKQTSKYTLSCKFYDDEMEMWEYYEYNINSDVVVSSFKSVGAPDKSGLTMSFPPGERPHGFIRFDGNIGGGRIFIKCKNGFVFKGVIEGGPQTTQSFVGAGTWTKS